MIKIFTLVVFISANLSSEFIWFVSIPFYAFDGSLGSAGPHAARKFGGAINGEELTPCKNFARSQFWLRSPAFTKMYFKKSVAVWGAAGRLDRGRHAERERTRRGEANGARGR